MRLGLFFAFATLWPCLANAQDWATRAFCEVDPRPVTATDFAPDNLAELEARASEILHAKGRFWQIESPDGAVSHLWGTFHVSNPAILDLPEPVKDTIAAAQVVALENDFTFPDRDAFLNQLNEPGRYRDPGDPFSMQDPLDLSFLPDEVIDWVYQRLDDYGTTEDALFVLTYAGLAALLLADPCEDYTAGVVPVQDDFIYTLGHIAQADVIGLEAPEAFFSDLSEREETAKAIVAVYASYLEPPRDSAARAAMFQLYLDGRLGLLSAWDDAFVTRTLGPGGKTALDLTNEYLVAFRNQRFMESLAQPLEDGGAFIAVGAAHLPGETGLVSMLRNAGFSVERIPLPGEVP